MTTTVIETGQIAPDFKLKGPGGQPVTLSEYKGQKNVVLVFYPLAFSSTCSHQLPGVQAAVSRVEENDGVVLGISVDSHHSNTAFAKQLGLTFVLLSDWKRETARAYGTLIEDAGISGRATFVIDKQGQVAHAEMSEAAGDIDKIPSIEKAIEVLKTLP